MPINILSTIILNKKFLSKREILSSKQGTIQQETKKDTLIQFFYILLFFISYVNDQSELQYVITIPF